MLTLLGLLVVGFAGTGWVRAPVVIHPPKVVYLRDGSTVTVTTSGTVTVRSRHGQVLSESSCGSATRYWRWENFMTAFQGAVRRGDRAAVASKIAYPLRWATKTRVTAIGSRAEFLERYTDIFRPTVVKAILAPDPHALFCQNMTQASIGSGVIWGDVVGGRPSIITINPPAG